MFGRNAAITPSGIPNTIANSIARSTELERLREVLLDDVVHVVVAEHERRPEVERGDALDVERVLHVPRLVEVELSLEVPWTAGVTARSLRRNGLPSICRIIRNVIRMTSSRTGIVQSRRLMMNPAMSGLCLPGAGVDERQRAGR